MPRVAMTLINSNPEQISDEAWKDICLEMFNYVVALTPVDTGYCLSNWEMEKVDRDIYIIKNETPYVSFLEDGWSGQAPGGMLQPALQRLGTFIRQRIRKRKLTGEVTASVIIPDYIPVKKKKKRGR